MKPVLRQITANPAHSFLVRKDIGENMINSWHYHSEIELLLMKKSSGTWLIGDHIGHFQAGDVVLLGPNLPHCFRHEFQFIKTKKQQAGESICVKFLPELFGSHFFELPESVEIKKLFSTSCHGLKLKGNIKAVVGDMVEKIAAERPGKRLISLLTMLELIAHSKEYVPLSTGAFAGSPADTDKERVKLIFDYTFHHFSEKITIDKCAALLNMTRQSFCRYFKCKTNKTYVEFLMEVRIGHACRLLVEEEESVTEICYDCGYNNISHFNHQFKRITGKKPLQYKSDFIENNAIVETSKGD